MSINRMPSTVQGTAINADDDFSAVVFRFIKTFIQEHSYSPSLREIGKGCRISWSTAVRYVDLLAARGLITRENGIARSIALVKQPQD